MDTKYLVGKRDSQWRSLRTSVQSLGEDAICFNRFLKGESANRLLVQILCILYSRAEGIKLFLDFHHFACFIQCTYVCRFRKSLYGITSFTQKSENPLQKVSDLI